MMEFPHELESERPFSQTVQGGYRPERSKRATVKRGECLSSETQHNITNHNRTKREDISHQTINVSLNSTQQRLSKFIPKQLRKGSLTLKCSKKCVHRDWSERADYISIKHAPYITQVHCGDIMHAAYVIGTSARNSRYIL